VSIDASRLVSRNSAGKVDVAQLDLASAQVSTIGRAIDTDTLIRSVLFIAIFLSVCISFHPFLSLAEPQAALNEGNDRVNQIAFSIMFLVVAVVTARNEPRRLTLLLRPVLLAVLAWCAISALASWEPFLAIRRLAFTLMFISISGMVLLLPKNLRHFGDMLAAVALIVIALCYLGVLFAPSLSIHQLTDSVDTEHAGLWRGIYTQKNTAGAMMVLFIFVGMFVARARSFAVGAFIVVSATIFLLFTASKTDLSALPIVLILAAVIGRGRRPAVAIVMVIALIAVLNLLSVGTIYFEPVRNLVRTVMPDATFTGRTEIWDFALRYAAQRPILGYGFSTFWGTEEAVYGLGENSSWVNGANDAHNAYVNLALTIGVPGLILVVLWLVALPLIDFYRSPREPSIAPVKMLFLRICLFAAYGSCFESLFFGVGGIWFFLLTATFGLRFLSATRVTT